VITLADAASLARRALLLNRRALRRNDVAQAVMRSVAKDALEPETRNWPTPARQGTGL